MKYIAPIVENEYTKIKDMTVKELIDASCEDIIACQNCRLQLEDNTTLANVKSYNVWSCLKNLLKDAVEDEEMKRG